MTRPCTSVMFRVKLGDAAKHVRQFQLAAKATLKKRRLDRSG